MITLIRNKWTYLKIIIFNSTCCWSRWKICAKWKNQHNFWARPCRSFVLHPKPARTVRLNRCWIRRSHSHQLRNYWNWLSDSARWLLSQRRSSSTRLLYKLLPSRSCTFILRRVDQLEQLLCSSLWQFERIRPLCRSFGHDGRRTFERTAWTPRHLSSPDESTGAICAR